MILQDVIKMIKIYVDGWMDALLDEMRAKSIAKLNSHELPVVVVVKQVKYGVVCTMVDLPTGR